MNFFLRHCKLYALVLTLFFVEGAQRSPAEEISPLLTDMEEYTVFAALLFPEKDTNSTKKIDIGARLDRLNGITGKYYRLSCFTIKGMTGQGKASDQEMTDDYNRKNSRVYQLDKERLLPLIPEKGRIVLIDPGEKKLTEEGLDISSGVTHISRPGFNKDKTRAIIQINHVAGPEMGVGYLVYMEKSPSAGRWIIVASDMNRMY